MKTSNKPDAPNPAIPPRLQVRSQGRGVGEPGRYNQVSVELKALQELTDEHRAQVHNYIEATGHRVGLWVNFGHHPGVEIERIIRCYEN